MLLNLFEPIMMLLGNKKDWNSVKNSLKNPNFIQSLRNFSVSTVNDGKMAAIRKQYVQKSDFSPEEMKKRTAVGPGLCNWVIAVARYHSACRKIWPKKL